MIYLPDIENISTFVMVVKLGGFTKVAKSLGLSTNAISRRVKELESALGVRLLVRTTRSVALTEEGSELFRLAEKNIMELAAARAVVQSKKENVSGLVRIGLPSILATEALLGSVQKLSLQFPELKTQILVSDGILDQIRESVDISIEPGPLKSTSRIGKLIGKIEWKLAASVAYVERYGMPKTIRSLEKHNCLAFVGRAKQKTWTIKANNGKLSRARIQSVFESNDSRVLRQAVYGGIGIGPVANGELSKASRAGLLRPVLPDYSFADASEIYVLYHKGADKLPRNHVMLELLLEECRRELFGSAAGGPHPVTHY